jgi:hypothetical protein
MFNKNTQAHGIGYVLGDNGMRADPQDLDKPALRAAYERSDKEYMEHLVRHLKPHADRSTLLTHLGRILQSYTPGVVDDYIHRSLPSLLATIFAIWTLSHVEDAAAVNEGCDDLKKPHPAQVVAICRLLGLGIADAFRKVAVRWFLGNQPSEADVRESLFAHHLVQVGTGEGKSIILAVTAAVLAVIGFEVNVACYSQYLTERDFESFCHCSRRWVCTTKSSTAPSIRFVSA